MAQQQSWVVAFAVVFVVGAFVAPSFQDWTVETVVGADRQVTALAMGGDEAVDHAVLELQTLAPSVEVRTIASWNDLLDSVAAMRGTLILIGHGVPDGLELSTTIVPWTTLGDKLREGPHHTVLVLACYSGALGPYLSAKRFLGFRGLVDVDEAAYLAAGVLHALRGDRERSDRLTKDLVEVMGDKAAGRSSHPLLTLTHTGYATKLIRGIWHVRVNPYYQANVRYTHPDTYIHYHDIGIEWSGTLGSLEQNLLAGHIPKSRLDSISDIYSLAFILSSPFVGLVVRALLTTGFGALVGAIIAAFGWYLHTIVEKIRDESSSGWVWIQNRWQAWWGEGMDIKTGSLMWFRMTFLFGQLLVPYALWYGGTDLGIEGW